MLPQMKDINNVYHANVFYPNYGDSTGQSQDITYMKNRVMAKSIVDLQIGSSILGKTDP
jgi:hypothetical protein